MTPKTALSSASRRGRRAPRANVRRETSPVTPPRLEAQGERDPLLTRKSHETYCTSRQLCPNSSPPTRMATSPYSGSPYTLAEGGLTVELLYFRDHSKAPTRGASPNQQSPYRFSHFIPVLCDTLLTYTLLQLPLWFEMTQSPCSLSVSLIS